jgi:hypothetical protein
MTKYLLVKNTFCVALVLAPFIHLTSYEGALGQSLEAILKSNPSKDSTPKEALDPAALEAPSKPVRRIRPTPTARARALGLRPRKVLSTPAPPLEEAEETGDTKELSRNLDILQQKDRSVFPEKENSVTDILKSPPAGSSSGSSVDLEPHIWKHQMATMGFSLKKDDASFNELITATIHLVEAACIGRTLQPTINTSEECQTPLQELIKLFPNAPAAVCARDGVTSSTCREAHQRIKTEIVKTFVTATEKASDDFIGEVDPREEIQSIHAKLGFLYNDQKVTPAKQEEIKRQAAPIFQRLLALTCREENYAAIRREKTDSKEKGKLPFLTMKTPSARNGVRRAKPYPTPTPKIQGAFTTKGEKTFTPEGLELVRLQDRECATQIKFVTRFDPELLELTCASAGNYSPSCIEARKKRGITVVTSPNKPSIIRPPKGDPSKKIFKSF